MFDHQLFTLLVTEGPSAPNGMGWLTHHAQHWTNEVDNNLLVLCPHSPGGEDPAIVSKKMSLGEVGTKLPPVENLGSVFTIFQSQSVQVFELRRGVFGGSLLSAR